ncbi:ChaN family lipoprotein [Sagittula sp.]|uniref:ChaN family lipoprotein n=1 Tax=Sagittula sp. TaxID=2038081 RepID=UPI0035111EF1
MKHALVLAALMVGLAIPAASADGDFDADVLFLGEIHDNPAHHARQAEIVARVQPKAVVWEMISGPVAVGLTPEIVQSEQVLEATLSWEENGWPDFSMYYPIFKAAEGAQHFGAALPREEARRGMGEPPLMVFGADAWQYGLDRPLPADQQAAREALQKAAHCDALPDDMLAGMVNIQRLRDARLAAVALEALGVTGGPVVVITGNGHARKDWGAPAVLAYAKPEARIFALAQGEEGHAAPEGGFDRTETAPATEREDPCAAIRK